MTDIPNYIYKLAMTEDVVSKGMVKLLEDFNIYDMSEEKALKLFYSVLAHLMYHLDVHPGQYFKLKYIDITSDKDNFICVRRNSDYSEDTVDPQMFYNRFCGSKVLREELQNTLDLFAKSFLGIKEEKQKERHALDEVIRRRKKLTEEIDQCTDIARYSDKQKKEVLSLRKKEHKQIKRYEKDKIQSVYTSNIELAVRTSEKKRYQQLEESLRELWDKDNTQLPF